MNVDLVAPNRLGSDSTRWCRYDSDVIPLWVADMDFAADLRILDAIREQLDHGVLGYGSATEAQRDVLVRAMQRDYDWQIKPEWLVFLPGVEPGFNLALSACTSPFGGAMQELSVYAPLRAAPGNWGLIKNEVWQSAESGRWESNHAEMVAAARISSAMLFATRRTQLGAFIPAKSWSFGPSYACATTWWLSRTRSIAA